MKKAFMLVAIIAMIAAPVFAEVELTISGDATTSFGYNLDTEVYGLNSDMGADFEIMIGALDGEDMGEGNWYGIITLEGASLSFGDGYDDGDFIIPVYEYDEDLTESTSPLSYQKMNLVAPEVAAKITNGNFYVQLQDTADFDADFVDDADIDDEDLEFEFDEPAIVGGSLTVGGTIEMATIAVEFATASSYEDATQTDGVVLGANLGLDLAPIMVDLAFAGAFGYALDQEIGFAIKVTADVAPLMITAAFDGLMNDGPDFLYEASLNVAADLDPLTVGAVVYFANEALDAQLSVGFANDMLTADAFFAMLDIIAPTGTDMRWKTGLDMTFMVNSGITANAGVSVDSDSVLAAYADVAFTELVDNVTFTIGWEDANDMLENDADPEDHGFIYLSAGIEF